MSDLTSMAASQAAEQFYSLYTTAYIGAGDGDTAFDVSQVNLQGTNTARVACSSVVLSGDQITFTATFDVNTGNFHFMHQSLRNGEPKA